MIIGVPKEIKPQEKRVGVTVAGVTELVANGHQVFVETKAGEGIGESDADYQAAGANILGSASEVFAQAEMIVKVKEPQAVECKMLRADQILFTYLHLAPDPKQTKLLVESGVTAIAYETVTDKSGGLPLLAPMSEVAGRLSIQAGMRSLESINEGRGLLLGGVPGVKPANVVILGGGVVGINAAKMACGAGADVTILDRSLPRLRYLDDVFNGRVKTIYNSQFSLESHLSIADLVIGGVLIPGDEAPKLVQKHHLKIMQKGAVIVDVSIDQGGCCETSKPTTHAEPIYVTDGIVHYCVANMPGAVPRTSTYALTNATLPFVVKLANLGYKEALLNDSHFLNGLNVYRGKVTNKPVTEALPQYTYTDAKVLLN